MYLRLVIQVSIALIWWFVIVPLISKHLADIKWMRRNKWTRKKFGFYGIAAIAFIFVYCLSMYAYTLYKRWEHEIRTDMKQSVSKAAESKVPSAATSIATVAELEPAILPAPPVHCVCAQLLTKEEQPTGERSKMKFLRYFRKAPTTMVERV